jgi:hypothetical protein
MRNFIKIAAIFLFSACMKNEIPISGVEMRLNFENVWWELTENPSILEGNGIYCLMFEDESIVDAPADGLIWIYDGENDDSHVLGNFERLEGGYFLEKYDAVIEILANNSGFYTMKLESGILSDKIDIVPCSFDL